MPYLNPFPTNLDEVKFVGKLLITSFQMIRCALREPAWSGINVSAIFHV